MAYLSLYRKYRPQTFSEILGQEHVSTTLANAVAEDRVAHAYLFTGPRGTGKTSAARILAKALNCEKGPTPEPCGVCDSCRAIADGSSLDVMEIDAASHSKVDETRDVLAGVPLATAGSRKKVYVIDEVHMLSPGSFNALLKTLEEPPEHVVFVLATTEAHKVLPTIISRTQRFDFRPVPVDVLQGLLGGIAKSEGIDVQEDALGVIARHANGSARDALSALDQLSSYAGGVTAEVAEHMLGRRDEDAFEAMFTAISAGDPGGVLTAIQSLIAKGADSRQLALGALEHARSLLLLRTAPEAEDLLDATPEDLAGLVAQAAGFSAADLLRAVDLLGNALTEMRTAPNHRLLLEVALVRAAAPETDPRPAGLLARIERLERRIGIAAAGPAASEGAEQPAHPRHAAPDEAERPAATPETPVSLPETPEESPAPEAVPEPPATPETPVTLPETPEEEPEQTGQERVERPPPQADRAEVGLTHVRDTWAVTLREVNKRSKRVGAFLHSSRPLRFDGDLLVVETQSDFHAGEMKEDRNREMLVGALHDSLGIGPRLTFVARGEDPDAAAAEALDGESDYSQARELEDGEHDPVDLVKKGFGAEVVEEIGEG